MEETLYYESHGRYEIYGIRLEDDTYEVYVEDEDGNVIEELVLPQGSDQYDLHMLWEGIEMHYDDVAMDEAEADDDEPEDEPDTEYWHSDNPQYASLKTMWSPLV